MTFDDRSMTFGAVVDKERVAEPVLARVIEELGKKEERPYRLRLLT